MKKISIDIPHFYCLEYKEDEKRLIVEIDFREPEIWIRKSLIQRCEPPIQSVRITEQEKEEIYTNIKQFLLERYPARAILESGREKGDSDGYNA